MIDEKNITNMHVNVIVISLSSLSAARIENSLPYLLPIENSKHYYKKPINKYNKGIKTISADYYFLSGVKSEPQFKDELKNNVLFYL
jgi:hypothetical protein